MRMRSTSSVSPAITKMLVLTSPIISISFWYISNYPAKMSADSLDIWRQVTSRTFEDTHTVSYGIFVWLCSFGGNFLPGVALLQSMLVFFALYLLIGLVIPTINLLQKVLVSSVLFITPFIGAISVTLWKDVPYTAISIIGLILLVKSLQNQSRKLALPVLCISLGSTFRHDGWPTLFLMSLLFFGLFLSKKGKFQATFYKRVAVSLLIASILGLTISNLTPKVMNAPPKASWAKSGSFLADLQFVNATKPELLPQSTRNVLNSISQGDSLLGAKNCATVGPMIFSDGFDTSKANEFANQIPKLWLSALNSKAAGTLLEAHYCRGKSFLPPPFSFGPSYAYWIHTGIDSPNNFSLSQQSLIPGLKALTTRWENFWATSAIAIAWPGLHLGISIAIFWFFLQRRKSNFAIEMTLIFVVCHSLVLIGFTLAQDFRYTYSGYFVSLVFLSKLFLGNRFKGKTPTRKNSSKYRKSSLSSRNLT